MEIRKRWMEISLPKFLGFVEKTLEGRSESKSGNACWLVGECVTIADISWYADLKWVSSGVLDGIPTSILDDYPNSKALMERVEAVDGIEKWMGKHSKPYSTFEYEP